MVAIHSCFSLFKSNWTATNDKQPDKVRERQKKITGYRLIDLGTVFPHIVSALE